MIHLILIILLILLVVYAGTQVAFIYSFRYRTKEKAADSLTGKVLNNFYRIPGRYLTSLHVVALALMGLIIYFTIRLSEPHPVISDAPLLLLAIAVGLLLLGIIVSHVLSSHNPDRFLTFTTMPTYLLGIAFIPLTRLLLALPKAFLRWMHVDLSDAYLSKLLGANVMENKRALAMSIALSIDQHDEAQNPKVNANAKLFQSALQFSNVRVRDCIVPRTEIVAVEVNDSIDLLMQQFIESGKTKIIIYQEDLDHIIGYVHSSDMFRASTRSEWTKAIRQIPIVPESMSAQKMMQNFMQQKKTIALVADEFGGTAGIISLEDLVEEIFGDIEDEHDSSSLTARKLPSGEYLLSARLEIQKANQLFSLQLPISDEYITIGGFILFHYQAFPHTGQTITIGIFQFTILKKSSSKIELVKLKVNT